MLRLFTFFTFERLFVLFVVSVVAFIALTFTVGFAWSWFFLLIIIFLIFRYFMLGSVGAAGRIMQEQDFEKAEKMLNYTWKPEFLQFGMKAMYYFLKGVIDLQKQDFNASEKSMLKAVDLGLPDTDSNTMAYINLASLYVRKNRKAEAKEMIAKAKKLKSTTPQLIEYIKQIEAAITAPQVTMQQQLMMQRKGGFRRNR